MLHLVRGTGGACSHCSLQIKKERDAAEAQRRKGLGQETGLWMEQNAQRRKHVSIAEPQSGRDEGGRQPSMHPHDPLLAPLRRLQDDWGVGRQNRFEAQRAPPHTSAAPSAWVPHSGRPHQVAAAPKPVVDEGAAQAAAAGVQPWCGVCRALLPVQ